MRVTLIGIPKEHYKQARQAVKMVDKLVWGGEMCKKVKHIKILKNSKGDPNDPPIFRGIIDVYNPRTKTCNLHIQSLIEMGQNTESNLQWSICHDLAHAFDVAHGNLSFNKKRKTIKYLGKNYNLSKIAQSVLPEEYLILHNFRDTVFYAAHDYYEPWETRPLIAADACMAEFRRKNHCPNLLKEAA